MNKPITFLIPSELQLKEYEKSWLKRCKENQSEIISFTSFFAKETGIELPKDFKLALIQENVNNIKNGYIVKLTTGTI